MKRESEAMKISIHSDCLTSGSDYFHVRIVVDASKVATFIERLKASESDMAYDLGGVMVSDFSTLPNGFWAWGEFNGQLLDVEQIGDSVRIDMSFPKEFGAEEALDYTKDRSGQLPIDFWLKPSQFIKSILDYKWGGFEVEEAA